jgi:hypothetical protein
MEPTFVQVRPPHSSPRPVDEVELDTFHASTTCSSASHEGGVRRAVLIAVIALWVSDRAFLLAFKVLIVIKKSSEY